MNETIIYRAT